MILGTVLAWDFYVLPPDGDRVVFMSHDELFGIYTKTSEVKSGLTTLLGDEIMSEPLVSLTALYRSPTVNTWRSI